MDYGTGNGGDSSALAEELRQVGREGPLEESLDTLLFLAKPLHDAVVSHHIGATDDGSPSAADEPAAAPPAGVEDVGHSHMLIERAYLSLCYSGFRTGMPYAT